MSHNNQWLFNKVLTLTTLGLTFIFIVLMQPLTIRAQSDPGILPGETSDQAKDRPTQVTASVSDIEPPSTPILISPEDDSKLTQNKPTFVWKGSTDNFAMSHYVLELNDETKFDDIPLVDSDNSDYTLTYNSTTEEYTLVVKNSLSDGSYTWNILAVDIYDNQATSVVWDFSIDTKAPTFIITTIDGVTVEISNQDTSTVPTTPIELTNNAPQLSGTGEGNSSVRLTLTFQDGSTDEYTFTIGSDGKWSVTLDTLPRDQVIYLDFIITDSYGNVSILSDVPLILRTPVVIIPLPTFPSEPVSPTEEPTTPPQLVIPILPLPELLPPIIRDLPKQIVYYVRSYEATTRLVIVTFWEQFWKVIVIALLLALPLLKLLILVSWWWKYLSAHLFKQLLWVIGWWKSQRSQGMAISRLDQDSIGFSLVTVSGKTAAGLPYKQEWLTNQEGQLPRLLLPEGVFRMSMKHPLYFFPTLEKRPEHLEENTYYTGGEFKVEKDDADRLLVLVAEPLEYARNTQLYLLRQSILTLPSLSIPLAVLAGCISIFFPSILNLIAILVFILLLLWKKYRAATNRLEIDVRDPQKKPIDHVVVALRETNQRCFSQVTQTDSVGIARSRLTKGNYFLWTVDFKRKQTEGNKRNMTSILVSADNSYFPVVLTE